MEIDLQKNLHCDLPTNLKNKMFNVFTEEVKKFMDAKLVDRLQYDVILDFFPVDYLVSNFIKISVMRIFPKEESI